MLLLFTTVFLPIVLGALLLIVKEEKISRRGICIYTGVALCLDGLCLIATVAFDNAYTVYELFRLNDTLVISFWIDSVGKIFAIIMALVWIVSGFYSFEYMKHEEHNKRFYGFYIMVLGILMGLCFAQNMITYYAFYELMTIGSFALVLHNQSREAIMAGLKYLFYSFAGAYMVLFGIFMTHSYTKDPSMSFGTNAALNVEHAVSSGVLKLSSSAAGDTLVYGSAGAGAKGLLMLCMFLMILGFSVKAGMFPMHGWLPTAHPVAPAPASAVLSAIIVKAGVLGIIRVIFGIFGENLFSGSAVQKICIILSLITVFMGSMLAYKEKVLKKRLAYSTVSQVSYILFGLFMINEQSFYGSMIHVAAHATIKSTLFLCAGAIIYITGCTRVDELRGIGKKMPVMLWCFTIASLGLIGIPPFGGFVSKWYLCVGALSADMKVFSWLGPVILLVSALLTAGYLLPISINGFLPGKAFNEKVASNEQTLENRAYFAAKEPKLIMLIPIIILTLLSVFIGLFPEVLTWL